MRLEDIADFVEVPGFSAHKIHRDGRFLGRKNWLMSTYIDNYGYKRIKLKSDSGEWKQHGVHMWLMLVFGPPRPSDRHVPNHINGIPCDNRMENLEWVTPSENALHAYRTGLHVPPWSGVSGEKHPAFGHKVPRKLHLDINKIAEMLKCGKSPYFIGKELGIHRANINNLVDGKHWQSSELEKIFDLKTLPLKRKYTRKQAV